MKALIGESGWECFWLMELYRQKKRNLLVPLEPIPFPTPPGPLIHTSGQAPSPLTARTAGKGKLEVLGEKPGHLVAQGAYTGKADFI